MTKFEETLLALDSVLTRNHLPFVVIGGFAVIAHGMQRYTQDIDITIAVEIESLKSIAENLLQDFVPRKPAPIEFFQRHFVLPVRYQKTGIPIDISAGIGGFDKKAIERAIPLQIQGRMLPLCTIEDLIIYKTIANRLQDQADLKFLVALKRNEIDRNYLFSMAKNFVELERSDVLENVIRLLADA